MLIRAKSVRISHMDKYSFVKSMFLKYSSELTRFVAFKYGSSGDADDIIQDAFHNFLSAENPEKIDNPRAYLYKTANNLALNRIRKNQNHDKYVQSEIGNDESALSPERSALAQRELEELHKSVESLPFKCRQAFILSRVHSKTYPEIALELQVSVSSVEKYLITALKIVRESIDA